MRTKIKIHNDTHDRKFENVSIGCFFVYLEMLYFKCDKDQGISFEDDGKPFSFKGNTIVTPMKRLEIYPT